MPYRVIKVDGGWQVRNKNTGKTYKKTPHRTKKAAEDQMAAMYANTKNEDVNPIEAFKTPSVITITDIAKTLPDDETESETIYYGVEGQETPSHHSDKCSMLVRNLKNIKCDAEFICSKINDGCEVEEWMKHKLSICYAYLNDIADSLGGR